MNNTDEIIKRKSKFEVYSREVFNIQTTFALNAIYSIASGTSCSSVSTLIDILISVAMSGGSVCQCGLFVDVDVEIDASDVQSTPKEVECGGGCS